MFERCFMRTRNDSVVIFNNVSICRNQKDKLLFICKCDRGFNGDGYDCADQESRH